MSVSAMIGKPMSIAPAPVAYLKSSTSPRVSPKANTRFLQYSRHSARLACLDAAEGHGGPDGEIERVDGADRVPAVGDDVSVPPHLDFFLGELVDDAPAVRGGTGKHHDAPLLEVADHLDRGFVVRGCAEDRRKPGHPAVDELDAPGAELHIINRAVEITVPIAVLGVGAGEAGAGRVKAGHLLRFLTVDEAHRLDDFRGQQGCHAAVQRLAQIGGPALGGGDGVQQVFGVRQNRLEFAQLGDFAARHTQDNGQIIGRIRKGDGRFGAMLCQRLIE